MSNAALFTTVAREYANFRPGYPPELFSWLARVSPSRDAVWDAGCGSGQASVALAEHFSAVHATDIAAEQIAAARSHPKVHYAVAPAEASGLADASVDLVTVAQSLHWFDLGAFYAEARRVARPDGLIAVWTYPRPRFVDASLDERFEDFYVGVVGPYWPAERKHVDAVYASLPFPFAPLEAPAFALTLEWNLAQVLGYVSSWSATARYKKANGADPVPLLEASLATIWTDPDVRSPLRMPLGLKAARLRAP
ncbi:MAG: class I SAM-dependent methyltransferase [Steroidobacteraceae bacterium]|nr:class I SAM-dependent methyltransferase [Steroidobacteraceae bacterium]